MEINRREDVGKSVCDSWAGGLFFVGGLDVAGWRRMGCKLTSLAD